MELIDLIKKLDTLPQEDSELSDRKIFEVESTMAEFHQIDRGLSDFIKSLTLKVRHKLELIGELMSKIRNLIENYENLCDKAKNRVILSLDGIVDEKIIISEVTDYPGKIILFKNMLKLRTPDYLFALMQQKVLKNRELSRSISKDLKNNPDKIYSYDELFLKDKGAAIQALNRAFITITGAVFEQPKYEYTDEELCFFEIKEKIHRAVFLSVVVEKRGPPNLFKVKSKYGENSTIDPHSEAPWSSETEVIVYAGSITGTPVPIKVRIPYFIRSYSVKLLKRG